MSSIPSSVRIKVERANKHIVDLGAAIDKFFERRPHSVVAYIDEEHKPTYCLKHIEPIDSAVSAVTGDVIQNLRTALDYLAGALWLRTNRGEWRGYFPICESSEKYESESPGKTKGMPIAAKEAIDRIAPYEGGNDVLWRSTPLMSRTSTDCSSR